MKNRTANLRSFKLSFSWAVIAVLASSCANSVNNVLTSCVLPADQTGTMSGMWTTTAIPIAFHAGDFSSDEINAMTTAADTWNAFYGQSQNLQLIDYGSAGNPRMSSVSKPSNVCGQTALVGGKYTNPIVIYRDTSWPYASSAIALTTFCSQKAKPLAHFYMAIVEVNFANYFVAGKPQPDMQSIILHELGHVAGLNHSCEAAGTNGTPACSSSQEYADAVMGPVFTFDGNGSGQQKQVLTQNDQGRANCLYDGQLTSK